MNKPDPLDSLLQRWQPQPSARPDFGSRVHQRITAETARGAGDGWRFSTALPLAASLAIVAGSIAGAVMERPGDEHARADAYARSIDPVRMMGLDSNP